MSRGNKSEIINEFYNLILTKKTWFDVLELNGTKWNLPLSTFNRYWKEAKSKNGSTQKQIEKKIIDKVVKEKIKETAPVILNSLQIQEILSAIGSGKMVIVKEYFNGERAVKVKEKPSFSDMVRALGELNKIQGNYEDNTLKASETEFRIIGERPDDIPHIEIE